MTGNEAEEEARVETGDNSGDDSWCAVGSAADWQTTASLCYYTTSAATSFIRDASSVSESLVGLFLATDLLGYTVFPFPSGATVDGYDEKPVMVVGPLTLSIALVGVTSAPPSYLLLLMTVALLRTAYSTVMPAPSRGVVAVASAGSKDLAMGLKQVSATVGSGASSFVVTDVAVVVMWQVDFWTVAVFVAGCTLIFAARCRRDLGTGRLKHLRLADFGGNRAYATLITTGLLIGVSTFSTLGYTVPYVQDVVGTGPVFAGGVLVVMQVTGGVGRIGAGGLADRLGRPCGAATTALVQLAGAVALFSLPAGTDGSFALTIAVFMTLDLAIHGSAGVFYFCLSGVVDDGDIGVATAGGWAAFNVDGLIAPSFFGFVVESTDYGVDWVLVAGSTMLATVLLFVVRRRI